MTTLEIGNKLVELCKQGKNHEAMETLYAPDVVAVEAVSMAGMPAEIQGLDKVLAKSKWWGDNHTIHSASVEGPWPNGDRFAVRFSYDVTSKPRSQRFQMDEIALFTVKNGKIVREEFFYVT